MTADRHIVFVTGRLASPAVQRVVGELADQLQFRATVATLPITVAALMTTDWIARRLQVPPDATEILLPGYCRGDLAPLEQQTGLPVSLGPRDLFDLPQFLGRPATPRPDYGLYDIELIAEINHAPDLPLDELLAIAAQLRRDGADVIDLGCNPGQSWPEVGTAVRELRAAGHRISIDSFDPTEIEAAIAAGAELVLSVNSTNRDRAIDWDAELVVIPDEPATLSELGATIELLQRHNRRVRIDPILEPIGCGFAQSLLRYDEVRRRYPALPMMMGVGNLTELTDCDSAGINVLLTAFCQELQIHSLLTTQVISWARTSVRELDVARRLSHYALAQRTIPKHVDSRLIMLRDVPGRSLNSQAIHELAGQLKDANYRLFVADGAIHVVAAGLELAGADPYELFGQLLATAPRNLDISHAFYLGYELAKAKTALTLGKQYRQDEALDWGLLTEPEESHDQRRRLGPQSDG